MTKLQSAIKTIRKLFYQCGDRGISEYCEGCYYESFCKSFNVIESKVKNV